MSFHIFYQHQTKTTEHAIKSTTAHLYEEHKLNTTKDTLLSIEEATKADNNDDIHDQNMFNNYAWYSMIHSLFEPFEFIVYSGSHLMKQDKEVHEISKLKLQF
jgi:hypothetical protein